MPYCPRCGARLGEDVESCPSCLASTAIREAPPVATPERILFISPVDTSPLPLSGPKRFILALIVLAGLAVAIFSIFFGVLFLVAAGLYYYIVRRSPNRALRGMQYVLTNGEARVEDMSTHVVLKRCSLDNVVAIALNTGNRGGCTGRRARASAPFGDVLFVRGSRTLVRFDRVAGAQNIVDKVNEAKASAQPRPL